uniref:Small ribosomal subunit protein uS3c n=1 Tax=Sporolithon durum TaxID=48970 RepID=A0A141SD91_9FLOR|nr:ribosomal protein S3 [Sporolithon durum]AMK96259.1 ribosomal protein S3 [Sporolithon durum]
MGQKTHPLGFRIGIIHKHKSAWFTKPKKYSTFLQEDYLVRSHINKKFKSASIVDINIDKKGNQIEITIKTARPGIILSRLGSGVEELRQEITKKLKNKKQVRINIIEITDPDQEACLIAEFIVQQLEKRIAFRRVIRQAIQRAEKANIQGIKIQVSGRLNGAEIARNEWLREGRVPLQTLRADIQYSYKIAQTIYGILGIKVWIFKGEILKNTKIY